MPLLPDAQSRARQVAPESCNAPSAVEWVGKVDLAVILGLGKECVLCCQGCCGWACVHVAMSGCNPSGRVAAFTSCSLVLLGGKYMVHGRGAGSRSECGCGENVWCAGRAIACLGESVGSSHVGIAVWRAAARACTPRDRSPRAEGYDLCSCCNCILERSV